MGKCEFGLYGVICGMTVIVLLAYTIRLFRGKIAAVSMRGEMDGYCYNIRNIRPLTYWASAVAAEGV